MKIRLMLVCVLVTLLTGAAVAQTDIPDLDAIGEAVQAQMDAQNIPGLAIAVVYQGEVIYAEGFGVRSIEDDAPVTSDTLFRTIMLARGRNQEPARGMVLLSTAAGVASAKDRKTGYSSGANDTEACVVCVSPGL